jgi:predicted cobalt transporter CbtA
MIASLLLRGLLVGVLAGVLAFGFARVFGEPHVDHAIAIEEANAAAEDAAAPATMADEAATAEHSHGEEELVSRGTQAGIGLLTGVVVYGAAIGGIFSLVFAFAFGRVESVGPRALAAALALIGFVVVILVPQIKYPANPPAVGHGETIAYRTAMFMAMLVLSVAAAAAAAFLRRKLLDRLGAWNATLAAGGAFIVVVGTAMLLLPAINEVPDGFPPALLWQFRLASLGTQAVLWATLGIAFGALTQRSLARG